MTGVDELLEADIIEAIVLSLVLSAAHCFVQVLMLLMEASAYDSDFITYYIACMNGRVGFVPCADKIPTGGRQMDFDALTCLTVNFPYTFTDDTIDVLANKISKLPER